jgi:ferric-dicitrate binding protein FerR (iron transport regulator)
VDGFWPKLAKRVVATAVIVAGLQWGAGSSSNIEVITTAADEHRSITLDDASGFEILLDSSSSL